MDNALVLLQKWILKLDYIVIKHISNKKVIYDVCYLPVCLNEAVR